jgi:hypothetical protein
MKKIAVVIVCIFFASCAMIFPVSSPNISAKEYTVLHSSNNQAAKCYSKGIRGWTIFFDIILFWPAVIVDAAGGFYTYYAYEPEFCSENQVMVDEGLQRKDVALKSEEMNEPVPKKKKKKVSSEERAKESTNSPKKETTKNSPPIFVAVLESASGEILEYQETQFITNVLREEAVRALSSRKNTTIMTRENIAAMLPPEKSLEECEGSCLVETGKNISADFVSQARIGRFGNKLTISVELYKTANYKLISSFNAKAPDIDSLEEAIREKSPQMFKRILEEEAEP